MRTMNITCPVCQQTHPNTHLQLLDYKTASYPCPVVGQVVVLDNYIPGSTTLVVVPGTTADTYNDSGCTIAIGDTLSYVQVGTGVASNNVNNETLSMASAVEYVADKTSKGFTGDLSATWMFKMDPGASPSMNHKLFFTGTNIYVEADMNSASLTLNFVNGTPATPAATAQYSGSFLGTMSYIAKLDIIGSVATLSVWQSGTLYPPIQISVSTTGLVGNFTKSQFTNEQTGTLTVNSPAVIMHNAQTVSISTPLVTPVVP
jgi:hypothetical protein